MALTNHQLDYILSSTFDVSRIPFYKADILYHTKRSRDLTLPKSVRNRHALQASKLEAKIDYHFRILRGF